MHNPEAGAREIFLTVILPDTAFISRFAIEVSGQLFVAFVKEKEEAWREYQSAVEKGRTAGERGRGMAGQSGGALGKRLGGAREQICPRPPASIVIASFCCGRSTVQQ